MHALVVDGRPSGPILAPAHALDACVEEALDGVSKVRRAALAIELATLLDGRFTHSEIKGFMNRATRDIRWSSSEGVANFLSAVARHVAEVR